MAIQLITRIGSFDSGHRVMNERMKCFNLHGHTYIVHLTFAFSTVEDIGYQIDFKEIKRIGLQWIDDILDHGSLLNPKDTEIIEMCQKNHWKYWLMSLNGYGNYCNPTVENIAKEVLLAMEILFHGFPDLAVYSVKIYETPNCYTEAFPHSVKDSERLNFRQAVGKTILDYANEKGIIEYDERKVRPISGSPATDTPRM